MNKNNNDVLSNDLHYKNINKDFFLNDGNGTWISSLTYGEVDYISLIKHFETYMNHYNITSFLDIGSGSGKIIVGLANIFDNVDFTGIEILRDRYDFSQQLREKYNVEINTEFILGSFMDEYIGKYECLYCCNTIFSREDNTKLYNKILNEFLGVVFLFEYDDSLKPYLMDTIKVKTSWCKYVDVNVFYIT